MGSESARLPGGAAPAQYNPAVTHAALSIPMTFGTYAIWMAVWMAIWTVTGFIWLQVHWIRRAARAYQRVSPAERLLRHARHFRDHHAKPAIAEMQREWKQWRKDRR